MTMFCKTRAIVRTAMLGSVLMGLTLTFSEVMAADEHESVLTVTEAWTRSVPVAGLNGAGYLTLSNSSEQAYRLVSVETEAATTVSLHESLTTEDGMTSMKALPAGVEIPPGQTVKLAPGGIHVMLMGMTSSTEAGEALPATFIFQSTDEKAPKTIRLQSAFTVRPVNGEAHTHHH